MGENYKYNEQPDIVESGNYNTAKIYAGIKIAKPIMDIDELKRICWFGTSDIDQEFSTPDSVKHTARLSALYRMIKTTQMIIDNSLFAIKKAGDREDLEKHYESVLILEKLYKFCSKKSVKEGQNGRSVMIVVNEEYFNKVLDKLIELNRQILFQLNRSDLIFVSVEEFDPDKFKEYIKDQLVNHG